MSTRYQVFVSSTYRDLQDERREVMQALLEMDCFPAGMELFPAADDDAWTLIKSVITESDYFVAIVAGRYGSVDDAGISFTEKECDFAHAIGKPISALLHKEPGQIPFHSSEREPALRQKLECFRAKLEHRHSCKYWTSAHQLGGVVAKSINWMIKNKPTPGWVRGGTSSTERPNNHATRLILTPAHVPADNKTWIRAFVKTNGSSDYVIASLSESTGGVKPRVVFGAPRPHGNETGILITVILDEISPPTDWAIKVVVSQQDATEYGPPVLYHGD